jgi:hypothetical protein
MRDKLGFFKIRRQVFMKQIRLLLFTIISLSLSGCAAGLIYDQDRKPRDCRQDPDQRCLNSAGVPDEFYRVTVKPLPEV